MERPFPIVGQEFFFADIHVTFFFSLALQPALALASAFTVS
jgi:hypothetical protein